MLLLLLAVFAPGVAAALVGIPILIMFGVIFLAVNVLLYPFGMGYFVPPVPIPQLAGYEVVVDHQKALDDLRRQVAIQREEILQGIDNQLALGDPDAALRTVQRLQLLRDPEFQNLEKVAAERMKAGVQLRRLRLEYRAEDDQTDALIREGLVKMDKKDRDLREWQERKAAATAKRDAAMRFLVSQKDRVGGIVWYQDRSTPPGREGEPIFLVIRDGRHARDESQEGLHLGLQVHRRQKASPRKGASQDVKVSVLADGEDLGFYLHARKDPDGPWWSDNSLEDYGGLDRLDRLLQARKVVLRFREDGRRPVDVPVSQRARTAMRHVRDAYRAMKELDRLEFWKP